MSNIINGQWCWPSFQSSVVDFYHWGASRLSFLRDRAIRNGHVGESMIPPEKYCHWLDAPVMDIARRRLDFRAAPRKRSDGKSVFSDMIRDGRMKLCLTQEAFAKKFNVALKVLRDLEQGKTSAISRNKYLGIQLLRRVRHETFIIVEYTPPVGAQIFLASNCSKNNQFY